MSLIADSGAIYALYDADDAYHHRVKEVIENETGIIFIPVVILAELDYLLREFLGTDAELSFLDDLFSGAYTLESLTMNDFLRCRELIAQYRNLDLGLADTSVMAIAERLNIYRILTVDERDFRAVRPKKRKSFIVLPADADFS